jgi:glycosyltransferase involved in cell wall biosynthesis
VKLSWAVEITGTMAPTFGYRRLSAEVHAALTAAGVEWTEDGPIVLHVTPPHLFDPADAPMRNVVLTMWESDAVPPPLVARLNRADLVLVPCRQNQRALRWSGVRRPVRVVPLGLSASYAGPSPAKVEPMPMRFLWVGQPNARKGWDLLLAAWAQAFPDEADERVALILKTNTNGAPAFTQATTRTQVIAAPWTDAQMAELYRACHVFVFPTRGEGFGLPVLEAMAAECLVLAPPIGGLADFFDARVGWPLDWRPARGTYGVPVLMPETRVEDLALAMRRAIAHWGESGTIGLRARARERALTWTWARTATSVLDAIAAHLAVSVAA